MKKVRIFIEIVYNVIDDEFSPVISDTDFDIDVKVDGFQTTEPRLCKKINSNIENYIEELKDYAENQL